jgi:DNA-binding NtrC family response regulator
VRALKTLIVDDDRDLADSLAILLELEGHEVALAYDARQALSSGDGTTFDIVLMDIQLPDRSGLDCLAELGQAYPRADLVLMTAYGGGALARAQDQGALGVLLKPLDVEELSAMFKLLAEGFVPVAEAAPGFADRLTRLLEDKGYASASARTPDEARSAAAAGVADVVVLDLAPGVLDPTNLVEGLAEACPRIPIVVVGHGRDEETEAEGNLGHSVIACFAATRDEMHVLQRIEKVREYYEHNACNEE